ncbi:MAG: PAS domain S-box protein [Acetobacteraceae bacterium]|nr:PAS domain S-box protein [Acetobacteraceae bacterium]
MPEDSRSALPEVDPIRAFAERSPSAILLLGGLAHRILYANPVFCEAAGRPATELLGRTAREAFPSLAAAGHLALFDQVRGSGAARRYPGLPLHLYPDGPLRFWDVEVVPVRDRDGATCGLLAQLRDVTAQQTALREGEAARATLDALFEHIPEGLILADAPAATVVRVSTHGLHLAGRAAEEVLRRSGPAHVAAWEIHSPDGEVARPEDLPLTRAVLRGEQVQQETWMVRHRDGRLIPILCSAGPIRDAGGRITGGILAWRDITDLRQAEAALAASEARYRALVEAVALAVWIAGPDGELRGGETWAALTGQTEAEAASWGWLEAVHPEDRDWVRERWATAVARGEVYRAEYRLRWADGGWRWTASRAVPLRDAAGAIVEWIGVNTDIEARKQAEQALAASEERFRTLAEAMPHLVWQTDARGEPNYINQRMQDYTGRDLVAMRNGGWLSTLHPEDVPLLARTWGVALAGGGEYDLDARIRGADGGYRWFRVRGAPVRDAKGAIRNWVGTCTDVEDQHRAEAALHEAMEAQKELVREAEHRIKNSLQLVAALMRLQAGRVEETEARTALEAATARVQAVAEAHRALQKSPDLRSVRLADMLRELAAGVSVQHPGADLRIEAPEGLMLDAERAIPLALILAELAGKALRHGLAGPVCLSARIAEGTLLMEVTEPGRGAPEIGPAAELGGKVIGMLARQIGARVTTEAAANGSRTALVMELERTTAALP